MVRVAITGLGIISPIGNGLSDFWNALKSGKSGVDWIEKFDVSQSQAKVAAQVKDFDPTLYMDRKEARRNARFVQMAVASGLEAFENSGLNSTNFNPETAGIVYGIGLGGMDVLEEQHTQLLAKGPGRVSPFLIPMTIANMASGVLAIRFNFKGTNFTVSTACASSSNAIGEAARLIQSGIVDVAMTGGSEATITPLALAGFTNMTALSSGTPETACRPFDLNRDGFVMAEGAATLILEEFEHAKRRGAKIYAELVGYGSTDDAYHITSPEETGNGAYRSMRMALEQGGLKAEEIDYINAHGTSTPLNDITETKAIKSLFGNRKDLNISSTKSMHGHALGAAGAIEAVATVLAMNNSLVPPTINYRTPDPQCDLNYTPNEAFPKEIKYALSNSLGFGGHNASLIFKK